MPAAKATGRLTMRAMTAAAKARSNKPGPRNWALAKPRVGRTRIAVKAETLPAMAQASVDIRPANTPAMRAASGLAADARMARPARLLRRNHTRAATTIGVRNSIAE